MAATWTIGQQSKQTQHESEHAGPRARREFLALIPVTERRLPLAGFSTAVLEGGGGPPLVLLHRPAGYAAHWMRVIPGGRHDRATPLSVAGTAIGASHGLIHASCRHRNKGMHA